MKRAHLICFSCLLAAGSMLVLAGPDTKTGVVMDAACGARVAANAEKTAKHTVACALMESCKASGFGLILEGRFLKFDPAGDEQALKLLEAAKVRENFRAEVTGEFSEDDIKVSAMKAAKREGSATK
ncbi:MAG: hypothetical protein OXH11_00545 [Candidatus Aminicenantes bacterium]|nr:hypothetical protein [Candidatus Aminicenantes bacterium]